MYNVEKVRYEHFPTYAIQYLRYNDDTNLTDDDKKNIYKWLEQENLNHACLYATSNYTYFSKNPQFGIACDCMDVFFMYPVDDNQNRI